MKSYIVKFLIIYIFFINFLKLTSASFPSILIQNCYDGDTCTTSEGEIIRLACIDTPEIKGRNSDLIPAIAARNFVNNLIANKKVFIKRITKDKYGRTVAELFLGDINIQELIVKKGYGRIYRKYANQCSWSKS